MTSRSKLRRTVFARALVASVLAVGSAAAIGCSSDVGTSETSPLSSGADFIAIPRPASASTTTQSKSVHIATVPDANASESFYLAINKKALADKYFLTAYMKQYFPGAVAYGAATSLGARVVTFRVQNGKLFVFDASDGHASSDTFDPELIVDAYPIVDTLTTFNQLHEATQYVLVDPAAGLNQFGVVSDLFASQYTPPSKFTVELSFLQRFRTIADGATFEQVFTGYGDIADPNSPNYTEANQFHGAGTLGIALRKYAEGPGFAAPPPMTDENYFRRDLKIVKNTGGRDSGAVKWNIKPGMRPIKWVISGALVTAAQDPAYAGIDVVGAVKAGIENWNEVFGYPVLQASIATPDQSFADDDTNYLIWDQDPSLDYAFANWRTNPNTGEVRGASVYMNQGWLDYASQFWDDAGAGGAGTGGTANVKPAPHAPSIVWQSMPSNTLCSLLTPDHVAHPTHAPGHAPTAAPVPLTRKQKIEQFLTHTVLHEVGHTLGLRHNFKGSLVTPSSSVMDYLEDDDAYSMTQPGTYDVAAIKYLYGMANQAPSSLFAFCTDEQTTTDPNCNTFDKGANPLTDYYAPYYSEWLTYVLTYGFPMPSYLVNDMAQYVRAGSWTESQTAWSLMTSGIQSPIAPANAANYAYAYGADNLARTLFSRLYLDPDAARGNFTADPPSYSGAAASIRLEVAANLRNDDGVRTFPTRRVAVDVLKKLQMVEAYDALVDARASIAATRPGLVGDAATQTDDLLARIDAAISPYFTH